MLIQLPTRTHPRRTDCDDVKANAFLVVLDILSGSALHFHFGGGILVHGWRGFPLFLDQVDGRLIEMSLIASPSNCCQRAAQNNPFDRVVAKEALVRRMPGFKGSGLAPLA